MRPVLLHQLIFVMGVVEEVVVDVEDGVAEETQEEVGLEEALVVVIVVHALDH